MGSAVPDAFGPFRVLHQIGAGALGPVFRAYDQSRDRLVAIKLFRLDLPPERVHQLVAEFDRLIAADLARPGIAAPLAAGIEGVHAYLVHEFAAADSLDIIVRDYGPAPQADAVRVAAQLAGALDYAAVVDVRHGALHPRDVLVSPEDTRMTGLGVAQALEAVGVAVPLRLPYSAPERVAGGAWDRRADIFSLAALVFELLAGKRVAGTGADAARAIADVPGARALQDVFARALAEDPANRFATALEFAGALKEAVPAAASRAPEKRAAAEPKLPLEPEPAIADLPITPNELRAEEAQRFEDVQTAPAVPEPEPAPILRPMPVVETRPMAEAESQIPETHPMFESALERSRSAIWPLVLTLMIGVAVGFASGYALGNRERAAIAPAAPPVAEVQPAPPAPAAAPAPAPAKEFTEGTLPAATPAPAPPPAPKPAPHAALPPAPEGRLLVRSTPEGAHVFVDGREEGRTPATIRNVAPGSHHVRVVHDGFVTEDRRVSVSAAHPEQTMTVALARPKPETPRATTGAYVAELSIDSRPSGARVFLDGRLIGTTPALLPQVSAGEHLVRLEHDGYRRWSSSVRVVSGERNRVTASLEK